MNKKEALKVLEEMKRGFALRHCGCICHREPLLKHGFLCCKKCEDCGINVPLWNVEEHKKYCEKG